MNKDNFILGREDKDSITERKITEEEFNWAYSELKQIFNISVPLCVIDKNHDIVHSNETYSSLIGKTKEEIIGRKCYDVWSAQHCHTSKCSVKMIMDGIEQWKYEKERKKNGSKSTFIMEGVPFKNPQGEVVGIIENFIDITEKKEAEEALYIERKLTEKAINAQRDTYFIFEPSTGKAIKWNQAFKEITGYTDEEISKLKAPDSYYDEKDFKRAKVATKEVIEEGEALIEMDLITKDGSRIPFEYLGSPITDGEGNLKYVISIGRNKAQRKQKEEVLRENERSLNLAQAIAHLGHWKLDPISMDVSGSNEFFNIFGLNPDEGTLDSFVEVVHPDDREYDLYHIRRGIETGESWDIEHRLLLRDGTKKWVHAIGESIRDEMGEITMLIGTIQDISEQKNVENLIKEKNEFLTSTLESLTHPFYVINAENYNVDLANSAAFSGVLTNTYKCYKLTHMSDVPCAKEHPCPLNLVKKSKKPCVVEHIHYDEIGQPKHVEIHGYPIFDKEGNVKQMIEYTIDISERRHAEKKLRESEEKFRNITEQSLMGIAILQDNVVKYASQRLAEMYGYSVEEMLNFEPYGFLKLIDPDFVELVREQASKKQLGEKDTLTHYQVKIVKKNGEKVWVDNYSKTINYNGKPADLVTNIDITERKKAEEEIQYQARLVEDVSDAIISTDLSLNILSWNKAAEKIYGWKAEEVKGKNVMDTIPLEYPYDNHEAVLKQIYEEGFWQGEVIQPKKNGAQINVNSSVSLIEDTKGKPIGAVTINRDITEKKEIERLILEENEKLQELSQMRQDLITRISHELKTPLTSIYGVSQALLEIPEEELSEEILEYREIAQRGSIRLKDLIDNLLDASRLDSKRIELRTRKEDLVKVIKECVSDMLYWANDRKHKLVTDLPKELFFEIDKLRFSQVLINIISNAIKNTPLGGKILVKIKETTDYIDIQVKDTGVGLTDKEKENLFQKFGKIERYGKDLGVDIEGVGLGLYISKEIVELHGGQILVGSKGRNEGATFTIRLFNKEISNN